MVVSRQASRILWAAQVELLDEAVVVVVCADTAEAARTAIERMLLVVGFIMSLLLYIPDRW